MRCFRENMARIRSRCNGFHGLSVVDGVDEIKDFKLLKSSRTMVKEFGTFRLTVFVSLLAIFIALTDDDE